MVNVTLHVNLSVEVNFRILGTVVFLSKRSRRSIKLLKTNSKFKPEEISFLNRGTNI